MIAAIIFALLVGCGYSGPTKASAPVALSGSVHGGRQPVIGSTIQLYAAGTDGDGSVALPLLSSTVKTDSNGNFTIPAAYGCPSSSSPVYVVASGGNPGTEANNNPNLALTAVLGPCEKLSASTPVSVNEVTTVGSVFPLAAYMTDAQHLGSASGDASFLTAVATVPEFINSAQGTTPGTPGATSYFAEGAKLDSLADALAECVNSSGGSAGDGTPCGQLFAAATPAGVTAPSDTVTAALRIALNPKNNVANIYSLAAANPPFEPALTTPPTDWTLALSYAVAAPNISLPTGTYNGTQEVTLSDSTAGSTLYYTTDGAAPSTSSNPYTGPIAVSVTTTLQAIAVLQGSQSTVAASTLTITAANPAENLVFQQQPSNTAAGATMTPAVTVTVVDSNGNVVPSAADAIKLTLVGGSGLQGTLTIAPKNGVATFNNLSVSNAGTYTLAATSTSLVPAASTSFTISAPGGGTPPPPPAAKLAFLQQPSNASTGATITPAVTVVAQDGNGNLVTTATSPVTLALGGGTGLAGTLTATPKNGVATFSNLSVGTAGTYNFSASSPNLTSATSNTFTVTSSSSSNCSITSYGAVGDGVTNNASAIQNTFNYAAAHNCTALIPAGTFAYSGTLTAKGIAVTGTGAGSILKALDTNNEALTLTGNGGSISNLVMQGTGTTRNSAYQAAMIWVNGATNFTVQNVLIHGGSCVGIFDAGGQTGLIQNNTVENTLSDSITNTNGASNITVKGNHVLNSGDDGVSNNSYLTDPNTVHDITVEGNTIMHNVGGRGLEVSGGSSITFSGNYVDNLDGYTDMYIASESEWKTQNVSNITVTGNTFVDGGPNQGTAIIYNSEAGSTTISGVTINGNQFVNPKAGAVQYAGNGSETGIIVQNNTDYSTNAFSYSSNPTASPTQSGNTVLAPTDYTTPLVAPGGGCSFAGC